MFKLFFGLFLINSFAFAQKKKIKSCKIKEGSLIVVNQKGKVLKKFVERNVKDKLVCKSQIALAFIGDYFLSSNGEEIVSLKLKKRIDPSSEVLLNGSTVGAVINDSSLIVTDGTGFLATSFDDKYNKKEFIHIKAKDNLIGGMIGELFFASDGKVTKKKSFPRFNPDTKPRIEVDKDIVGVYWQDYLIASDFFDLKSRRLQSIEGMAKTAAADKRFVTIHGEYLYLSDGNEIKRKYFSDLNLKEVLITGNKNVIAAYIPPYFVAIDSKRFRINIEYVNKPGEVVAKENFAIFATKEKLYIYNVLTGSFSRRKTTFRDGRRLGYRGTF